MRARNWLKKFNQLQRAFGQFFARYRSQRYREHKLLRIQISFSLFVSVLSSVVKVFLRTGLTLQRSNGALHIYSWTVTKALCWFHALCITRKFWKCLAVFCAQLFSDVWLEILKTPLSLLVQCGSSECPKIIGESHPWPWAQHLSVHIWHVCHE